MPNYEYLCQKCGHRFEKIQKFSDPMLKKCPECGGKIEQVISAPAVQFKGGGWYVTDYAKKTGASKTESKPDSDGKADSGKDSAPKNKESETKKESKGKTESGSKASEKK